MPMDTPRRSDIVEHNEVVDETLTNLALVNLIGALEQSGLRVRQASGVPVVRVWDPRRAGESVVVVMAGGNTGRAVEEVWKEIRSRQHRQLPEALRAQGT